MPGLASAADLASASPAELAEQFVLEISRVLHEHDLNQEQLSHRLGYSTGSQLSRWLTRRAVVSEQGARALDEGFGPTSIRDVSFLDLHEAYRQATRRLPNPDLRNPSAPDVFLATPMAAMPTEQAYSKHQRQAMDLCASLEEYCNFSVYYAGRDIPSRVDFDAADIARERNFDALSNARYFVMVITQTLTRPSSALVEAGFALALRKPSLYLVSSAKVLPYVLQPPYIQTASAHLPRVWVEELKDIKAATMLLRRHRRSLFDRLQ